MAKKPTALGGDIFAGLFTRGVVDAGFDVIGHLEHTDYGVATARENFPGLDIRIGAKNWEPNSFRGKVDFMFTNPPCAAWSNMRGATTDDWEDQTARLEYVNELSTAGQIIQPKAWCWESVTNAWTRGEKFVREQARSWCDSGYQVSILLYDNATIGVPQKRERMMFIAHKHPLDKNELKRVETRITVGTALLRVPLKQNLPPTPIKPPPLPQGWEELWKEAYKYKGRMREAYQAHIDAGKPRPSTIPLAVVKRLLSDEVAPVMLASFMRLHPSQPRMLDWHEWLAFCGLPPDWKTACTHFDSATRELARAVMPGVGKWVATAVKKGFAKPEYKGEATAAVIDLRDPNDTSIELLWTNKIPKIIVPKWDPQSEAPKPKREKKAVEPAQLKGEKPKLSPKQMPLPGVIRPGSGARIREMLKDGLTPDAILTVIHKEFPDSKATKADVAWNKRKLRLMSQ